MSRSGYSYELENWSLIRWRGQVMSATRGKRGQALLRDLITALDAMQEKRLITHDLKTEEGVCALGAVGEKRGLDMSKCDPEEPETVAELFNIACPLAQEIVFMNDEYCDLETPEQRWVGMRKWAVTHLVKDIHE